MKANVTLQDNKPKVFASHCEKTDDCSGPWFSEIVIFTAEKLQAGGPNTCYSNLNWKALGFRVDFN